MRLWSFTRTREKEPSLDLQTYALQGGENHRRRGALGDFDQGGTDVLLEMWDRDCRDFRRQEGVADGYLSQVRQRPPCV